MNTILPEITPIRQLDLFTDESVNEQIAAHYQPMFKRHLTAETIHDVRLLRGIAAGDHVTINDMDSTLLKAIHNLFIAASEEHNHWQIEIYLKYIPATIHDVVIAASRDYADMSQAIHDNLYSDHYDRRITNHYADLRNAAMDRAYRAERELFTGEGK